MIIAWLFFIGTAISIDPKAQKLAKDLQTAADRGDALFTVQQGDYEFGSTPLVLSGASKLQIAFSGSTLWFDLGGGVALDSCSGVTVSDLTIDYSPTYAQGSLVSLSSDSLVADFDLDFMLPDPSTEKFFNGTSVKVAFWDEHQRFIRDGSNPAAINIFAKTFKHLSGISEASNTTRFKIGLGGNLQKSLPPVQKAISSGAKISVTVFPRGARHSVAMSNCTDMAFENSSIYGGTSMGVVESMGGGGNTYSHFTISRRPDRKSGKFRLLGVNADGFHSTSNAKGPTLKDSEIAFTGDDLGNVCCGMSLVLEAAGNNSNAMASLPSSPTAADSNSSDARPTASFSFYFVDTGNNLHLTKPGDTVSFYHLNSLVPQGQAVVQEVTMTRATSVIAQQVMI
jgi:hypothetical protein